MKTLIVTSPGKDISFDILYLDKLCVYIFLSISIQKEFGNLIGFENHKMKIENNRLSPSALYNRLFNSAR